MRGYDTDEEEAEHVATWLAAKHQPGSPWYAMAVLARTNAQLELVASYLDAANIPNERRGPEHSPASDLMAPEPPDAVASKNPIATRWRSRRFTAQRDSSSNTSRPSDGPRVSCRTTTPPRLDQLAEEQRLAYVALSRAEQSLLITWSRGRNDPRYPDRQPSRFLAPVEAVVAEIERVTPHCAARHARSAWPPSKRHSPRASQQIEEGARSTR